MPNYYTFNQTNAERINIGNDTRAPKCCLSKSVCKRASIRKRSALIIKPVNKILRKLSKGQYTIEAKLDLHGMTVAQARAAVTEFIGFHHQHGERVLLIIHGKGYQGRMPKLKNALNQWLRQAAPVLAFCSAMPGDGNRGAVYVLLSSRGD